MEMSFGGQVWSSAFSRLLKNPFRPGCSKGPDVLDFAQDREPSNHAASARERGTHRR